MKRREFITLLGGAAVWPLTARGQPADRLRRIGVLMGIADDTEGQARVAALRDGLRALGWIEGRNIEVEYRWAAGQPDLIRRYAAELIAIQPDVIMSNTFASVAVLKNETRDIPVVFVMVSDPVRMGLVESMARPGGNITGFTPFEPSLGGKWVELLKEIMPTVTGAAIMVNPETAPNASSFLQFAQAAGSTLGIPTIPTLVHAEADIERSIAALEQRSGTGLIIVPDAFAAARYRLIVTATTRHRLPLIAPFHYFTTAGGLASYGPNARGEHRRAAAYIDRILRGDKPADLPVQAATKFELVINLKTAKALGLEIPPTLLARADEVIE
jgi:putative tryptophan/tyrosine transport system substrate-binding protein